jgi:hypothetical protein
MINELLPLLGWKKLPSLDKIKKIIPVFVSTKFSTGGQFHRSELDIRFAI